jgi:hypothetical protein
MHLQMLSIPMLTIIYHSVLVRHLSVNVDSYRMKLASTDVVLPKYLESTKIASLGHSALMMIRRLDV